MVTLALLGPPRVSRSGADPPSELLWKKNLALLVYLTRSPRGRTRDHLIGLLWPESAEARARHSLNEALRVLRRAVGPALATEGDTVRLEVGAVQSDTDRLDTLDAGVLGHRFLEGFAVPDAPEFENWLAGERGRVAAIQLAVLGARAEAALAEGRAAAARELARAALAVDPHHEPSARLAMRALVLEGSRAQALAVFQELAGSLERDLGVAPEPASVDLVRRIRQAAAPRSAPTAGVPAEPAVPVVGSARAVLVSLGGLWSEARGGRAQVAVLFGDPGTGKSRLADELVARARLDGAVVTLARARDPEAPRETWSALAAGLDVPEVAGAPPEVLAGLVALHPDLPARIPAARAATPLPEAQAFVAATLAIADQRPVLVVLDDAHRAGDEVVELLSVLASRAGARPVYVLVCAARVPPRPAVDALAERVGRDLPGRILSTGPLEAAAVSELVRWAFPDYAAAAVARLARRVEADSGGNPFLAVELVRAVAGGLKLADGGTRPWPSAHRTLDDTRPGDLPESLGAALRLRFTRLSRPARELLCAAAVLGPGTNRAVLARAVALDSGAADAALDELEWARWLVGDARGYAFTTRLAREVVLHDLVTGGAQRRIRERVETGEKGTGNGER